MPHSRTWSATFFASGQSSGVPTALQKKTTSQQQSGPAACNAGWPTVVPWPPALDLDLLFLVKRARSRKAVLQSVLHVLHELTRRSSGLEATGEKAVDRDSEKIFDSWTE